MAGWQKLTLGDIFSGQTQNLANIQKEAGDLFSKYSAVADQLGQKVAVLNSLLGKTGGLLQDLQNTGIYVLQLEPSQGDLINRINNEPNPPTGDYSAGIVLGFSAVDLNVVINRYQKLIDILTKPVEIPK